MEPERNCVWAAYDGSGPEGTNGRATMGTLHPNLATGENP
jgi:hypothetical protein